MKKKLITLLVGAAIIAAIALLGANQALANEEPRYCPFDILNARPDSALTHRNLEDDPCGDPLW